MKRSMNFSEKLPATLADNRQKTLRGTKRTAKEKRQYRTRISRRNQIDKLSENSENIISYLSKNLPAILADIRRKPWKTY